MHEDEPDAATPLDPDEADGLIPTHVDTREELNLWEQENIIEAVEWALGQGITTLWPPPRGSA